MCHISFLPTQQRLHRMKIKNVLDPNCTLCRLGVPDTLSHALISCPSNTEVSSWLTKVLHQYIPGLLPSQIVLLDLGGLQESLQHPLVWLIAQVLSITWSNRREKKKPLLFQTRAKLEAGIAILRKTTFTNTSTILEEIMEKN